MNVIPTIDILDGKCVRLIRGIRESAIAYDKDPLAIAENYARNGAKLIHIVDLDGALTGEMKNIKIIKRLAKRFPIQVGGGIRSEGKINELLDAGAEKVVVSTILLKDKNFAETIKRKYYGRLIGSFDFKGDKLSYAGWVMQSNASFDNTSVGLSEVIITDTERDGTLKGPNICLLKSIRAKCRCKIISAGGVRDIIDLMELKKIGMDGVIVGKAFLENNVFLKDGLRFEFVGGD